jgi:hypothetical protein
MNDHPYSCPESPTQTGDPSNPWSYLPQLHEIMVGSGDGAKPIWLTEFGCPTGTDGGYPAACTDATLAQQITEAFNSAGSFGWAGPLFVYNWQDPDRHNSGDGDFGLYHADGSPKTATVTAYKAAAG